MDKKTVETGMSEEEFERQFVEATKRGKEEMANSLKAEKAYFDKKSKRLIIDLQNGVTVFIPTQLIQIFQNAHDEEIADIEIVLKGLYLRWNLLDEDLSVPLLLQGRFGTAKWMAEINSKPETKGELQKKVA